MSRKTRPLSIFPMSAHCLDAITCVFAFSPLMPREETHPRAHSAQGGCSLSRPQCSALLLAAARNGTSLKPDAALFPPLLQHSS